MDILKKNTVPAFQIVPRKTLLVSDLLKIELRNESTNLKQLINCTFTLLPNENYLLTLVTFPSGILGAKFSYSLFNRVTNELLLLGKLIIFAENQAPQDYSNQTNNNFYA